MSDKTQILIQAATRAKKRAQAAAKFLKTGKVQQRISALYSLEAENIQVYSDVYGSDVYVSVNIRDLEGFKSERLAGLLQTLEYWNANNFSTSDSAASLQREFRYEFNGQYDEDNDFTPKLIVIVTASVKDDSPTCKRVIVGYREAQEPQPIYKIECVEPETTATTEG